MKGTVMRPLNRRTQHPGVNSFSPGFYETGEVVNILHMVGGDNFEGNTIWYRLDTGEYVWSGAIDLLEIEDRDFFNPEDRRQFMMCFRHVGRDGFPDIRSQDTPKDLSFAELSLPQLPETVRVFPASENGFTQAVIDSINALKNPVRNRVVIYVHGYDIRKGLKVDLLNQFALNYTGHPQNSVAKVLFLSWPANGQRSDVDDTAFENGANFTINRLFRYLEPLKKELEERGGGLDLVIHSFGHQLLNGMLNYRTSEQAKQLVQAGRQLPDLPDGLFHNVFLMAPDITHLAPQSGGVVLHNRFRAGGAEDHLYHLGGLDKIARHVHVFYDHYDYLLYASSKKFNGSFACLDNPDANAKMDYRNLGNHGAEKLGAGFPSHWKVYHVQDLLKNPGFVSPLHFSFSNVADSKFRQMIEHARATNCFQHVSDLRTFINSDLFVGHHRYLFSCKPVVDKVTELMNLP